MDPGQYEALKRKRVARACDRCSKIRRRCDGLQPCANCDGISSCQYTSIPRRRGKKSRREQQQIQHKHMPCIAGHSGPVNQPLYSSKPGQEYTNSHENKLEAFAPRATKPANIDTNANFNERWERGYHFGEYQAFLHLWDAQTQGSEAWSETPHPEASQVLHPAATPLREASCKVQASPESGCNIKYPLLTSVLPHILCFLSEHEACTLFELYIWFSNNKAYPHQSEPPLFVFRKSSLLSPTQPRECKTALAASMLWAGASNVGVETLKSLKWTRSHCAVVCQKLRFITMQFLNPLVHTSMTDADGCLKDDDVHKKVMQDGSCEVDDIITYVHVATAISSSDGELASLRWWQAAIALAKEMRLGDELNTRLAWQNMRNPDPLTTAAVSYPEQEIAEERRRVWWLLFIQDRYLSLCHNRQCMISDVECEELVLPLDETSWQVGDYSRPRVFFPHFECQDPSIYGWLIPLMTIAGELTTMRQLERHHTFLHIHSNIEVVRQDIVGQIERFSESLSSQQYRNLLSCYMTSFHVRAAATSIQSLLRALRKLVTNHEGYSNSGYANSVYKAIVSKSIAGTNAVTASKLYV